MNDNTPYVTVAEADAYFKGGRLYSDKWEAAGGAENIETYIFDPNDGTGAIRSESGTIMHTYESAGTYETTVQIVGANGKVGSKTLTISVVAQTP